MLQTLGIDRLTVAQRILLVEEIWDSIATDAGAMPLSETQSQDLDRRVEAYRADPNCGLPWEEVKARL